MLRHQIKKSNKMGFSTVLRGFEKAPLILKPGEVYSNFEVKGSKHYPDYKTTLYQLEERRLGTRYYHFENQDTNNAFGALFRTLPTDDTGKPHILEHTALCGSEKYPVRDPFFNMLKRSLNTYMNAWTGPDFTMYPFSTQNLQDYRNLLSVYLDSVFKPRLDKYDFLQEGWRLEFENKELVFKGIVFNEMKGVFEDQANYLMEAIQRELFNGSEYGFCSGGEPMKIPDLNYEDFVAYHRRCYHPSNATFVSYGDLDVRDHLAMIQDNYLSQFERQEPMPKPSAPSIEKPKKVKLYGPPDAMTIKENCESQIALSFLCDIRKPIDFMGLNVLSLLLFEFPTSPFYQRFLEQNTAGGYCSGYGFESNVLYPYMTLGLKNISNKQEDIDPLKEEIFTLLRELKETGFDKNLIESVLHQIEINAKQGKDNFGINLFENFFSAFNYGLESNIDTYMNVNDSIKKLRYLISKEKYLEGLIDACLLQNQRYVEIVLQPNPKHSNNLKLEEKIKLKTIKEGLTEDDIAQIHKESELLNQSREQVQNLDVLPKLAVKDIPLEDEKVKFEEYSVEAVPVMYVTEFTNGLTHLRLKFDLTGFPESMINYLYLLENFLNEMGTKNFKYDEFSEMLNLHTNNIKISNQTFTCIETDDTGHNFVLNIACLDKNIEKMFNLVSELLCNLDIKDYGRMSKLIKLKGSEASNELISNALEHAISLSQSSLSQSVYLNNKFANEKFLCNYATNFLKAGMHLKDYVEDLEINFDMMMRKIVQKKRLSFCIHSDNENKSYINKRIQALIKELELSFKLFKAQDMMPTETEYSHHFRKDYVALPSNVNYVIESFNIPGFNHPDFAKINVMAKLLGSKYLHKYIRESGGAYGSGASVSRNKVLSLYSYRDPKTLETFLNFEKGVKMVSEHDFR